MKSIHVRLSDEEEGLLQEKAALSGRSVSEVVREVLFRDLEKVSLKPATFEQAKEVETRLVSVEETLRKVAESCGKISALEEKIAALLEGKGREPELYERLENAEKEIESLSQNVTRLVDLQVEERRAPFGLDRSFVQVATMASFTLARGTFSNNPEAWEPYKEEARRRAFKDKGE